MQPEKNVTGTLNEVITKPEHSFSILCTEWCWCSCVMSKRRRADGSRAGQQLRSYSGQLWGAVLFLMTSSSQLGHCGRTEVCGVPLLTRVGDRGGGGLQRASQRRKRADGDSLVEKISEARGYLLCDTLYKRLNWFYEQARLNWF